MKNRHFSFLGPLAALVFLAVALTFALALSGCGGNGDILPPWPSAYAGEFAGGEIVLETDRGGGGPMIDIAFTTVQSDGKIIAEAVSFFFPDHNRVGIGGLIIGRISKQGLVTALVNLSDGGKISVRGGPLCWQDGRGGPSRVLSGPVEVLYRPAGGAPQVQYLGSTFELWQ